jgi:hypothetical protein
MSARKSFCSLLPCFASLLTLALATSTPVAQTLPTAHHPGQWTTAAPWPGRDYSTANGVWAVHMALLRGDTLFARPHSQVLAWGNWSPTRPNGGGVWGWRPTTNSPAQAHLNLAPVSSGTPSYDIFCAGHAALPDGDLLVLSGTERGKTGTNLSARFDFMTRQWLPSTMYSRRWYGNATPTFVRDSSKILATAGNRGHHMVVFGGRRESDNLLTNDVRRYLFTNNGAWDQPVVDPGGPNWPDEREFPALTDSRIGTHYLSGGKDASITRSDVWKLSRFDSDLAESYAWSQLSISNGVAIPTRSRHVSVVSPSDSMHHGDTLYVQGGERHLGGVTTLNDFWRLEKIPNTTTWQWVEVTSAAHANGVPNIRRSGHTAIWDQNTRRMLMFGGHDESGNIIDNSDLYVIRFIAGIPHGQLATVDPAGHTPPVPRTRHAMAINNKPSTASSGVLFGGLKRSGATTELSNEFWEFTVTSGTSPVVKWKKLEASSAPAPRMDASLIVYTEFPTSYVILGGELASGTWDDDVWELRLDQPNQWQQLQPLGSPPALRGHRAVPEREILTELESEIYDPGTNQWSKFGQPKKRQSYHMIFHASDGKLYSTGPNQFGTDVTWRLDPVTEAWTPYASTTVEPLDGTVTGILYRPDQSMKCGGPGVNGHHGITNSLALGVGVPSYRTSFNTMARPRTDHTLNMLPSGEVISTGGLQRPDDDDIDSEDAAPRKRPELWDPTFTVSGKVGVWYGDTTFGERLAEEPVTRGHHSSSVILPDGRILSGGGSEYHPNPIHRSIDQYSPPYLFKPVSAGGDTAARPQLLGAQDHITWGQSFKVACPQTVVAACLIRPGASTHAFNQDVRYVPLFPDASAPQVGHNVTLRWDTGVNANHAPPGNYLLFVLSEDPVSLKRVPSVARWVNVSAAQNPFPTYATWDITPPRPINDLVVTGFTSTSHTLQWTSPGDQGGSSSKASRYEIRYRIGGQLTTLDDFFDHGVSVAAPVPADSGTVQTFTVNHPSAGQVVYFRIMSRDLAGSDRNWSVMSNEAQTPNGGGGCPFVDTRTATGWLEENSILGRSLTGALSLDGYRLRHTPEVIGDRVHLRIRENEQELTTLDQVRLIAVDHSPGARAFPVGEDVLLGTPVATSRATTSSGVDVTSLFSGGSEGFRGGPGDTVVVEFSHGASAVIGEERSTQHHNPFHIDDGGKCPPDCSYPLRTADPYSATAIDAQVLGSSGIQLQTQDGLGGWRTASTRYPREHRDEAVLDGLGHGPVRLVFVGRHTVRSVGRLSTGSASFTAQKLPLLAARHTRLGDIAAVVDTTGSLTSQLAPGDTVALEFGWVPVPEGQVRELFLLSRGVYTANLPAVLEQVVPTKFATRPMRPNPFAGTATLWFEQPDARRVQLEVLDAQGRRVRIMDRQLSAGSHSIEWDGRNEAGARSGPGVYFYRFRAGEDFATGRITRLP